MRGTNNLRSGEPWTRCTRRSGPCRPLTWWPATWPSWRSSKGGWRSEADSQKLLDWDRCRRDLCDLRKRENWKNLYEWNLNIHEILILMGDKISYIIIIPIPIPIDHEKVLFLLSLYIDFHKFSYHLFIIRTCEAWTRGVEDSGSGAEIWVTMTISSTDSTETLIGVDREKDRNWTRVTRPRTFCCQT